MGQVAPVFGRVGPVAGAVTIRGHLACPGGGGPFLEFDLDAMTARSAAFEVLLWLATTVAAIVLIVVICIYVRGRMRSPARGGEAGFSLEELRRLRDEGSLTMAEYEALKQKAVQSLTGEACHDG